MASHGGILGALLGFLLWARKNGVDGWAVADNAAVLAPVGIFLGRIANFINGELWGKVGEVPWAVIFPDAGTQPRHPSQLYEALGEGSLPRVGDGVVTVLAVGAKRAAGRGFFWDLWISATHLGSVSGTGCGGSVVGWDEPRPVVLGWPHDCGLRCMGLEKKAGG